MPAAAPAGPPAAAAGDGGRGAAAGAAAIAPTIAPAIAPAIPGAISPGPRRAARAGGRRGPDGAGPAAGALRHAGWRLPPPRHLAGGRPRRGAALAPAALQIALRGEGPAIEFRNRPDWPGVFAAWPGTEADAWGPFLLLREADLAAGLAQQLPDARDRRMLAALVALLPQAVGQVLRNPRTRRRGRRSGRARPGGWRRPCGRRRPRTVPFAPVHGARSGRLL
ncbi:hypothetical protein ACFQY5_15660 [Paeniroseomonas aquatica]|uniref:hypothetical protein n=1 Tax=Paeniroseomonas aquatica TaxID=373043 RepID=UPI00361BB7B9